MDVFKFVKESLRKFEDEQKASRTITMPRNASCQAVASKIKAAIDVAMHEKRAINYPMEPEMVRTGVVMVDVERRLFDRCSAEIVQWFGEAHPLNSEDSRGYVTDGYYEKGVDMRFYKTNLDWEWHRPIVMARVSPNARGEQDPHSTLFCKVRIAEEK
jgi:hypothetical protein